MTSQQGSVLLKAQGRVARPLLAKGGVTMIGTCEPRGAFDMRSSRARPSLGDGWGTRTPHDWGGSDRQVWR